MVAFIFLLGFSLLLLPIKYFGKIEIKINEVFHKRNIFFSYLVFSLFIAGLLVLLYPREELGDFVYYFERLQPLLIVLLIFPFQICLGWILTDINNFDKKLLIYPTIIFLSLILIVLFISISKLGISPDKYYWNVIGIPLTSFQFFSILFITFNSTYIVSAFLKKLNRKNHILIDTILLITLYAMTIFIWSNTPMTKNRFSLEPSYPYYQPFPNSDARDYDLGALSIVNGFGINFGNQTD